MAHPGGNEILRPEQLEGFTFGTPAQITAMEQEKQKLEWTLSGRSEGGTSLDPIRDQMMRQGMPPLTVDPKNLRLSLNRINRSLEQIRPPTGLTQIQIGKYVKLGRELTEDVMEGMPSVEMMHRGNDQDVQVNFAWQQQKARRAIARRNVNEILRANCDRGNTDPFFSSIETIRSTEAPKIDLRRYAQSWDNLRFTEEVERQMETPDDETFMRFAAYKGMDYSQKSIMSELGMTLAQYEACMDRWEQRRQSRAEVETTETQTNEPAEVYGPAPARILGLQFTSDELRQTLAARGITQRRLAEKIGMPFTILQAIFRGRKIQPAERLAILKGFEDIIAVQMDEDADESTPEVMVTAGEQ